LRAAATRRGHYDPACGTGGFLLAAYDYVAKSGKLDRDQKNHLRYSALRGIELVEACLGYVP